MTFGHLWRVFTIKNIAWAARAGGAVGPLGPSPLGPFHIKKKVEYNFKIQKIFLAKFRPKQKFTVFIVLHLP